MAQGAIFDEGDTGQDPAPSTSPQQIRDELKARGWTDAQIDHYMNTGGTPEDPIIMGPEDPSTKNPGAIDLPLYPDNTPPPAATKPAEETKPSTTTPSTGGPSTTTPSNPYLTPGADNPFGLFPGTFVPPAWEKVPDAPEFHAPEYKQAPAFKYDKPLPVFKEAPAFSYADFVPPSLEEAMKSPGYQFRLQQGTDRLQNAASARGTLNDSGTLKALIDYGQDSASQEYAHVFDRAATTYGTNYKTAADTYDKNYKSQYIDPFNSEVDLWNTGHTAAIDDYNTNYATQYRDPFEVAYKTAKDTYAPTLATWDANTRDILSHNTTNNSNAISIWNTAVDDWMRRRGDSINFALGS